MLPNPETGYPTVLVPRPTVRRGPPPYVELILGLRKEITQSSLCRLIPLDSRTVNYVHTTKLGPFEEQGSRIHDVRTPECARPV